MGVTIGEVSTTIESLPATGGADTAESGANVADEPAFEVRMEELRPLVRALVAEELERQLRQRDDCP